MILRRFYWVEKFKFLAILYLVASSFGCFMHYTDQMKPNASYSNDKVDLDRIQLPIKIKLDRTNMPEKIPELISATVNGKTEVRKLVNFNKEKNKYFIDNYYSEEILSKFQLSELFVSNPDANILVIIKPLPEKIEISEPQLLSFYTVLIVPFEKKSYGQIQFEVLDLSRNEIIKKYNYNISHTVYEGTSPFLFSPFIPLFSDYIDHSTNEKTFSIMRRAYQAFSRDFRLDISWDTEFRERFFIAELPNYSVQLKDSKADKKFDSILVSTFESTLISKGFHIYESDDSTLGRTRIDRIITIENFTYKKLGYGSTASYRIKFHVICKDRKNDQILWNQTVSYTNGKNSISEQEIFQNAINTLFRKLSRDGLI